MNTTSTSVVSTERQGLETLHTGYRGLAEKAPRSAGIPNPPVDQWKQLPVHTTEIDASAEADPELAGSGPSDPDQIAAQTADALAGEDIVQVDLGSVPDHDDPGRDQALSDARREGRRSAGRRRRLRVGRPPAHPSGLRRRDRSVGPGRDGAHRRGRLPHRGSAGRARLRVPGSGPDQRRHEAERRRDDDRCGRDDPRLVRRHRRRADPRSALPRHGPRRPSAARPGPLAGRRDRRLRDRTGPGLLARARRDRPRDLPGPGPRAAPAARCRGPRPRHDRPARPPRRSVRIRRALVARGARRPGTDRCGLGRLRGALRDRARRPVAPPSLRTASGSPPP